MFPCTKCGLCCQYIANIPELVELDRGDGVCKYYNKGTSTCSVYDRRPSICNIDAMYEMYYHKFMSRKEYYVQNANVCNKVQKLHNIDVMYQVKI